MPSTHRNALLITTITCLTAFANGSSAPQVNRWEQLGPAFYGVSLLAVDPHDPLTAYAGLGSRGLFRTQDGGRSWSQLSAEPVSSLAVDQFEPETIWAGFDSFQRRGLFRSLDRGQSWEPVGFAGVTIRGTNSRHGEGGIWPDPNRRGTLYVGTAQGVSKTTDGGATWVALNLPFPAGSGGRSIALDIAPSNSDILFASDISINRPENRDQILKSVNGGRDWTNAGISDPQLTIRVLLIHPSNPQTVFAGSSLGQRFYRTLNGGQNWEGTGISGGIAFNYVHSLALDQGNANRVYAASAGGLYLSTNSGQTFTRLTGAPGFWVSSVKTVPSGQGRMYAGYSSATTRPGGIHSSEDGGNAWAETGKAITGSAMGKALSWDGGAEILGIFVPYATPYGAARSVNHGTDWQLSGLTSTPRCLVRDPTSADSLWAGMSNGDVLRTTDRGRTWTRLPAGVGSQVLTLAFSGSAILAGTESAGFFKSQDQGESWENSKSGLVDDYGGTPAIRSLEISATNPQAILAATSGGVFRSSNGGGSWTRIFSGVAGEWGTDDVNEVRTQPGKPQVIYAATEDGLMKTTNGGEDWARIFAGVTYDTNSGAIKTIVIHPQDPEWIWIGTEGGVFRSANDGAAWDAVPWGLDTTRAREVAALEISSLNPRTVLAATGAGIYRFVGGESELYFPIYQQISGTFMGLAVANHGTGGVDLSLQARGSAGQILNLANNPAARSLPRLSQLGELGTEIFGTAPAEIAAAWVRMTATQPWLGSFQQWGNFQLTQMDGSVAWTESAQKLFFTRVFQGVRAYRGQAATTWISLANPHDEAVQVDLRLRTRAVPGQAGGPVNVSRRVTIAAGGVLAGPPSQVLAHAQDVADGVVEAEVVQGPGLVGAAMVTLPGVQTTIGFNAQIGNPGLEAFSAQLASAPGIETNLRLWNTSGFTRTVQLQAISDGGTALADPVTISLAPGQFTQQDAAQLFGFTSPAVGSLRVSASGDGVIGDVIFGDPDRATYAAALALQSTPFTQAVFSQVANIDPFFTGLAFYNPGSRTASVQIQVYSADGVRTGQTTTSIGPGRRRSALVPELVRATAGQVRGYIKVTSSAPIVGQQLFGTNSLSLMSAVPPTVVQ